MQRINFFVAGVQKSGTTALDAFLRRHPDIQMAAVKEPHFFDNESLDWGVPKYDALHSQFDWTRTAKVRGEATPIYTYWPNALERLGAYNRDAHLIVGLRHPTFRAFSHWRMETTRAAETLPFATAVRAGRARVAAAGVHRVFSYVERGFYSGQIRRLLSIFPRERLHFFRSDALFLRPRETLNEIQMFLGVDLIDLGGREYIVPLQSDWAEPMEAADRHYLDGMFAADIAETQKLTDLKLGDWCSPDYAEPMAP